MNYANTNHYLAPKFYVSVGKDKFFPGFSGNIGFVNFNVGKGSFRKGNDFTHDDDVFGFAVGSKKLFEPPKPEEVSKPDETVHASKTSEDAPKVDKTSP